MEPIFEILRFLGFTWWLWIFLILIGPLKSLWLFWRQAMFKKSVGWVLLELKMPREVSRGPQAMEQVLSAIHSFKGEPGDIKETYVEGLVNRWYSLELVSIGGEVHYFLRVPDKLRAMIEAPIFSYYPDVEVVEVEDYIERIPKNVDELEAWNYSILGGEMSLKKEDAYPIKTYSAFQTGSEENNLDPMGVFLELMGKLKKEETLGIQFIISPQGQDWTKAWSGIVEDLKSGGGGDSKKKSKTAVSFPGGGPLPRFEVVSPGKDDDALKALKAKTPGESEILHAVENNISKPAFETLIRFIYVSPNASFYSPIFGGISSAFNQYSSPNLNSLKVVSSTGTAVSPLSWPYYFFIQTRTKYRKQRLLYNYRNREIPPKTWMGKFITSYLFNWNFGSKPMMMNVESIATLFHPPRSSVLTGPHLRRVESRKMGPSAGLGIFGEEEEIEKLR